jgi:hypothetical protein
MPRAIVVSLAILFSASFASAQWKPVPGPLMTRWAKDVTPEKAHPEYPRPQMVRKNWVNLNGLWDYVVYPTATSMPDKYAGKILVPFPIESSLSGVMKRVGPDESLVYHRRFKLPEMKEGERLLLHFGAVDWECRVLVSGHEVGKHRGGYDPFSFDITDAIDRKLDEQILMVQVTDPTDASFQPRGKQVRKPEGIWYTPTTGIWQTVWLEVVPKSYISELRITPDVDNECIHVSAKVIGDEKQVLRVNVNIVVRGDNQEEIGFVSTRQDKVARITIKKPKLWSPDSPFLYDVTATLRDFDQKPIDQVDSYVAMRKISLGKDDKGLTRILLNNKFLFQSGPLDQGFWPDGLYTAPTHEAMKYDLEVTKKLGFNMVRKHVKVEPATWYRACDELGLLVWQDMPSGDRYIGPDQPDIERTKDSADNFRAEWAEIVHDFRHFPSIVMWVPFNEGWGQFQTAEIAEFTRKLDPTRLVNSVSGWADRKVGDVHDWHVYPGPGAPPAEEKRAIVLGEFGGLGLPLEGHTWQAKDNWGYRSYQNKEDLNYAFAALYDRMPELIERGLSAAVYTQTTDVEVEVNGLMTYDRAVLKIDAETAQEAHRSLNRRIVRVDEVLATSEKEGQKWRFTTDKPADDWTRPGFDDGKWSEGLGGFGEKSTPGSAVRTEWKTADIWLRRTAGSEKRQWHRPMLRMHWDEDTEVYFNGRLAAKTTGFSTEYGRVGLTKAGKEELTRGGKLTIAVHTHQTGGGQYIDVGVLDVVEED